jgi:non-ribosomal peptide synthase protein (TIGR01720 family)
VLVDVESHGREESVVPGSDVSRTTGWFTSLYPVRLDPGTGVAGTRLLKRVKEQLRRIPDRGVGFGLLRYLNPHTGAVLARFGTPQLGFNYLGRFGAATGADWTAVAGVATGSDQDPALPLTHVVEVNAATVDTDGRSELRATWTWAGDLVPENEVAELADGWFRALTALGDVTGGGLTPSDVALTSIGQAEIEEFEEELAAEWESLK